LLVVRKRQAVVFAAEARILVAPERFHQHRCFRGVALGTGDGPGQKGQLIQAIEP
jgi:hypothetical protein